MSRFGIRNRLKGLLGQKKRAPIPYHSLTYILPDGTEQVVEAEEKYSVLMASQSLPSSIGTGRRAGGQCPDGRCGLCRVEIDDHTGLSQMDDFEKNSLANYVTGTPHEGREREPGEPTTPNTRLACQARIIASGSRIIVPALVDYDALRGEMDGT
jgi:ferredoxin